MQSQLDTVAWAVPPGGKRNTRPARLVDELTKLGAISATANFYFHGRSAETDNEKSAGALLPKLPTDHAAHRVACFSPVFFRDINRGQLAWIDLYDDWSIAPDIHFANQIISAATYRTLRNGSKSRPLLTCNSVYMAGKLGLSGQAALVPNGVDSQLADLRRQGDSLRRLIILGHFFPGRTDFVLLRKIIENGAFDQIVIGGPGKSKEIGKVLEFGRSILGQNFIVKEWLSDSDLAAITGDKTVALVPNLVNDYTLSQDLMKVYQFCALGMHVIIPRLLWPSSVSSDWAFFVDYGVNLRENLRDWIDSSARRPIDRRAFVERNSWSQRALAISKLLGAKFVS